MADVAEIVPWHPQYRPYGSEDLLLWWMTKQPYIVSHLASEDVNSSAISCRRDAAHHRYAIAAPVVVSKASYVPS